MRYLTRAEVLRLHTFVIEAHGGDPSILSPDGLDNCINLPKMGVYGEALSPTIWLKAASLLHCIVTRHPFFDGNKRTGWVAAKMFLLLNGYHLFAKTDDAEIIVLKTARGAIEPEELAEWIENHSVELK